jgi:hypothetical protein
LRVVARVFLTALAVALLRIPAPAADGDPASDVLLAQNVFVPSPAPAADAQAALTKQVAAVYAKNYRVKVAVIAAPADLGAIPSLFDHPAEYAKFLGTELQFLYIGPLLIVMPSGYGIYDGGRSTAAEEAVLARLKVSGSSADDLTRSATTAVGELLAAGPLRSKDILAPFPQPQQATGHRGRPMTLTYRLYDDSGKSSAVLQVLPRKGRALATFTVPLRRVDFQTVYSLVWNVPRTVKPGQLRLCMTATDPSGNRSKRGCEFILVT